jgi:hypothetical protein
MYVAVNFMERRLGDFKTGGTTLLDRDSKGDMKYRRSHYTTAKSQDVNRGRTHAAA